MSVSDPVVGPPSLSPNLPPPTPSNGDGGILGLFETMSQMNTDTEHNFSVTKLTTQSTDAVSMEGGGGVQQRLDQLRERIMLEKRLEEIRALEEQRAEEQQILERLRLEAERRERLRKFEEKRNINIQQDETYSTQNNSLLSNGTLKAKPNLRT